MEKFRIPPINQRAHRYQTHCQENLSARIFSWICMQHIEKCMQFFHPRSPPHLLSFLLHPLVTRPFQRLYLLYDKTALQNLYQRLQKHTESRCQKKCGELCGIVGIALNLFLFAGKLIAGLFSHSVSVLADALNNLSDSAASIVTIAGFKASAKKPDADHPFGHGRFEYIAALIVSFFILMMGWELFKNSIGAIKTNAPLDASIFTIVTLVISIFVKLYMCIYNSSIGKK